MRYIIIVIIVLLVCAIYCLFTDIEAEETNHQCIIPNTRYPEIDKIIKNKNIIMKELDKIFKERKWTIWGDCGNDENVENIPKFSDMSTYEKLKHMEAKQKPITDSRSWKLFGLILEGKGFDENTKECPETYKLIKEIPGLINAGFSCLEPGSKTPYHRDADKRFYRIHIPLIVPKGDVRLDVWDDDDVLISMDWNRDFFVFDDTCYHQAFNSTDQYRIVLLLDIKRKSIN